MGYTEMGNLIQHNAVVQLPKTVDARIQISTLQPSSIGPGTSIGLTGPRIIAVKRRRRKGVVCMLC